MDRDEGETRRVAGVTLDRIKSAARNKGGDPQRMILRYALECWLHRLTLTPWSSRFVLKGGMLMPLLGDEHRPTEDIDGDIADSLPPEEVVRLVSEVCAALPGEEDGLVFDATTMRVETIRDGVLPGTRASFDAIIRPPSGNPTLIRIKLDLSYGDAITPSACIVALPPVLQGGRQVVLSVYPFETVLAEKLHSVVRHGVANTRFKDFYDILLLLESTRFEGRVATAAITATFERWRTAVPASEPPGLSEAFGDARTQAWADFMGRRKGLKIAMRPFPSVLADIRDFAMPLLAAASAGEEFQSDWIPGTGWGGFSPKP